MLILTRCACCDKGLWEDEQQHVCDSCGEVICPGCAGQGPCDAETRVIAACPECVRVTVEAA